MMKNLLILAALTFATFTVFNNFAPDFKDFRFPAETASGATEKVGASFRYAALLAKEPEAKIKIPLRDLKTKQIADTFGAPRGSDRKHQGQDLFAKRGTPVYSATEGYVWRVGENNLGGKTVWIIGAGGRIYYYAHLDGYAENLQTGDAVTTETILGFVGDTGNAKGTPPHLHFGVYTTGGAINPHSLFENR